MAVNIATAYIDLVPSLGSKGGGLLTGRLKKEMSGAEQMAREMGEKASQQFGGTFSTGIGKIAKVASGMLAGIGVAKLAKDSFGAAARVGELDVAMKAVGKSTGVGYEALSKTALAVKANGIEMHTAQEMALQFAQAGLDMSKAAGVSRVAQDLAVIAGKNSTEVTDLLTQAIMTQNTQLLRSAGVNKSAQEAYTEYGRAHKVAAADLTEAQKKQALMNMVLEEGSKVAGTYEAAMKEPGKVLRSFPRLFNDIAVAVGKPLVDAFGPVVLGVYKAVKAFAEGDKIKDVVRGISNALKDGMTHVSAFIDKIKDSGALSNFKKFLGDAATAGKSLLPIVKEIATLSIGVLVGGFQALGSVLANQVGPALKATAEWISEHKTLVTSVAAGLLAAAVAYKTVATVINIVKAAQIAWNIALTANPIGVIIMAIAALAAGLIYAYQKSETFRNIVDSVFRAVQRIVGDVVGFMIQLFRSWLSVWLEVVGGIVHAAAKAFGWVPDIGKKLKAADKEFRGFKDSFLGMLDDASNGAYGWGETAGKKFAYGFTAGSSAAFRYAEELGMGRGLKLAAPSYSSADFRRAEMESRKAAEELGGDAGDALGDSFGKAAKDALAIGDYVNIAKALGKNLTQGFAQGLILGKTTLVAALGEIVDKLDGAAGKIKDRINEMQQAAVDYAKSAAQSIRAIADFGKAIDFEASYESIRRFMGAAGAVGRVFTDSLKQLQGLGLRQDLIDQLVQTGPDKGLIAAQEILGKGKSGVDELNRLQGELVLASGQFGEFATKAQFEKSMLDELKNLSTALKGIPGPIGAAVGKALSGVSSSAALRGSTAVAR